MTTSLLQSPSFDVSWEASSGALRLTSPGRSLAGILGVEALRGRRRLRVTTSEVACAWEDRQTLQDAHGPAEEIQLHYQERQGLVLSAQVRVYPSRPFVLFRLRVINKGPHPVRLRRFFFRTLPGALQPTTQPTGFYRQGWQSWSPAGFLPANGRDYRPSLPLRMLSGPLMHNAATPWAGRPGRFWSEPVGALVTSREALVAGAASLADQFVQVWADLRPNRLELLLQSQGDDVPLAAGETATSEWFYLEWVSFPDMTDPRPASASSAAWRDPLAQYAYAVARQMGVTRPRPAPVGWSSWYIFWDKVAESDVMGNLATAALLAEELPLQVLQLDQGFEPIWGDWTERNERFPHSLEWLAQRVRGSGFTPGLWLAPLTVHPRSRLATEHPDWLLRDRRERPVSAGLLAHRFIARALDPTHPGVEEHLRRLIETAVQEWGYSYLKLDFLYAGALPGRRHDPYMTRAQAYRHALHVIREAAGEETYLVGCGAPLGPAIGLVDAMRIGPDTAPDWEPEIFGVKWPFRKNPELPSLRNSLHNVMSRAWMQGRWWSNDPDNLMVRDTQTSLTRAEVLAQATLLALSGGLLVLSDDLSKLSPERRAVAAALLPPLVEGTDVLDLFRRKWPTEMMAPVARPWGNWQLVGLFNWGDEPVERELPRRLPDFDVRQDYHIVDFWNRRYLRLESGAPLPKFTLPPHGGVLLSLRPVQRGPQLVATTYHISQGGEVTAWEAQAHSVTLTLQLGRVATGEVWLALPAAPREATLDGEPLSQEAIRAVARGVWAFKIRLSGVGTLRVRYGKS